MADGTIKIDIDIPTGKLRTDREVCNRIINSIGKDAGKDMDASFKKQASKLTHTASEAHGKVNHELGKPVKTKLEAEDSNLKEKTNSAQRDVDKIPKSKETKLEANDNGLKEKTENAQHNVDKIPKSKKTELQAKDEASPTLKKVDNQTEQTGHKFHRLRDIVKGTFIGSSLANGVSNALSAVGSHVMGVIKEGMQLDATTAAIERRFRKGMGMSVRQTNAYMKQIAYLKARIGATGSDIANLQVATMNWSRIGRKGAMEMVTALGAMGDRTGMDSQGYQRLAMMLGRVGSSGKVTTGTLSRLARIAPGLYKQLAKGAGVSVSQLKAMLATGKVTTAQFQTWLARSAKNSKSAFKEYATTQAGATNRMVKAWQTLEAEMTKPLFNMKTSALNQMADLMKSPAVTSGAKMLGNAVQRVAKFGLEILAQLSKHKADVTATMTDVVKIGGVIAKDIWEDFADILGDIGKALGLTHVNAKKSGSSLHTVREVMDGLAKNKQAMQIIARTIELMAAAKLAGTVNGLLHISTFAKGSLGAVVGLAKGFHGVEDVSKLHGAQKYFYNLAQAIKDPKGAISSLATTFKNKHKVITSAFGKIGKGFKSTFKSMHKTASKVGKKIANGASSLGQKIADKLSSARQAIAKAGTKLGQAFKKAWQKATHLSMGKRLAVGTVAGAAVATPEAINAVKDRHSATRRSEDIGGAVGAMAGGTLTSMIPVVGPMLAPIGAIIGKYAGRWGGQAVNKFTKGWQRHKPPKKFWSLENLGWSTHHMFQQVGQWGAKVAKNFGKGVRSAKKNVRGAWNTVTSNVGKFNNSVKRNLSNFGKGVHKYTTKAFSGADRTAKKSWRAIYKHSSKGTKQILKSVAGFGKRYVKSHLKYAKATEKNFGSFGKRFKKNHYQLFKTLGQTAKAQLKIERNRWHDNWTNIKKTSAGIWKGIRTNGHSLYNKLNRDTHGGLGKVFAGFHSFGKNLLSFWNGLMRGIRNAFRTFWNTVSGPFKWLDKAFHGKAKIGPLHFANGTDWRSHWLTPAILNDGNDSPSTHNRESIIHGNGLWELLPDIPFLKRFLLPNDEVVNAKDTARYFGTGVQHFARGTTRLTRIPTGRTNISAIVRGIAEIRQLIKAISRLKSKTVKVAARVKGTREMAKLAKSFKRVRNVKRRITVKVAGESKVRSLSRSTTRAARGLKSIRSAASRATRPLRTLSRQAGSTGSRINRLYRDARRDKFGSAIAKQAEKAVKSLKGKGNFAKTFSRLTKSTQKSLSHMHKVATKEFKEMWTAIEKSAKSGQSRVSKSLSSFGNRFKKQWKSIESGVHSSFSHFWSSMARTARRGLNKTISVLNAAISRIDRVVHEFGGSARAVHRVSHLATGTGYFSGVRRAITEPTLAIVNDGNDSPQTGNREAKWNPQTGDVSVFEGRNVPTILKPGEEVFNATEARMLGLTSPQHFASGTGGLKRLYEIAKHNWNNPIKTGDSMFSSIVGLIGAINSLAQGMKKTGMGAGVDWWSQLWKMVEDKVNDDGGPASGLLKAVEKYGEGHRYVYGASGPHTFDCSGLVMYALKHAYGIDYPHFSGAQYARTQHISKSQARMGDLVFWGPGDHVGVYAGGNRYFSAQSPSQGIHMNTLDSVVGKGRPLFGRVRGVNTRGNKDLKVKVKNDLQRTIRDEVGKGFWATIKKIADKYGTDGEFGNPAGDGVMRWKGLVKKALRANGFAATPFQVRAWLRVIARESGGNPHAVNHWDSNAAAGHPSMGLVQTIRSTFERWKHRGHNNIFNGYDDLLAGINYMKHIYGSGSSAFTRVSGSEGYARGGIVTSPQIAKVGEGNAPESIVPWDINQRERAYQIMQTTLDNFRAQDGQAMKYQNQAQQAVDLTKTNAEIESINAKFDDALAALGLLTSQDQVINVQNNLNGRAIGNATYEVVKAKMANATRNEARRISGR